MARMNGVEARDAGLVTRILYRITRRKLAKLAGRPVVVEPIKILAHHGRLLFALGQMELGQEAAKSVDPLLKDLASIRAAMLVGCPF